MNQQSAPQSCAAGTVDVVYSPKKWIVAEVSLAGFLDSQTGRILANAQIPPPAPVIQVIGKDSWAQAVARSTDLREEELAYQLCPAGDYEAAAELILVRGKEVLHLLVREAPPVPHPLDDLVKAFSLLAHGSDLVVVTDSRGQLLSASLLWRQFYGYSLCEIQGQNPRIVNSGQHSPTLFRNMWKALTNRAIGTWSGELVNRRRNGQLVNVWQTITAVQDRSGTIVGYLGQTRDMTAHYESRQQLMRNLAEMEHLNYGKAKLVSAATNDLRAQVQLVVGYTSLVNTHREVLTLERVLQYVDEIGKAGDRMLPLVQELATLHQAENDRLVLKIRRGNLSAMLTAVIDAHAAAARLRGVQLEFQQEQVALPVFVDTTKFDQILNAIVGRATRRAPDGSVIRVTFRVADEKNILVVTDSGVARPQPKPTAGNDPELTRATDTRDNLKEAQGLIQLHGGRIEEAATPDGLNTITTELPADFASFHQQIWAVATYDPERRIAAEVMVGLDRLGMARFVAGTPADFAQLCRRELPNLIFIEESVAATLVVPPFGDNPKLAALRPAEVVVTRKESGELRFVWRAGDSRLLQPTGRLLEAFRSLSRRATATLPISAA